MATLALSLAGQVVGGLVGGPIGATIGRALGALAGSAVDSAIFGSEPVKTRGNDVRLQGSSEGGAIPRLYGWNRVSGNIIWARELELLEVAGSGAKGFGDQSDEDEVGGSFAVAFGEGEVQVLGRIWADGQLLDPEGLTYRFYNGSNNQLPDSLIEATQGTGAAPAYRGMCYIVFEQLPLSRFGNRIPQFSVELCRALGTLEPMIKAVTVIPGATEFGYDPAPRLQLLGPGETRGENSHVLASQSDWTVSIDQLQALCPNLEHVALVVAWFGDDLRCANCTIGPRVEDNSRVIDAVNWSVAGLGRSEVPMVTRHDGGAAYGGTPSDSAVLAAIADLKARGIKVTLYPIVLMDIASDNSLTDPYSGGSGQPSYPWRGRITCDPAPGRAGTPDKLSAVGAQIAAFSARYQQMIVHYAQLSVAAGGVDALLIGSEMVGMTTVRGAGNSFPFVAALTALASDVRAIVGTGTKLTYAADWSEYGGYQPDGEKFFHLDPLWASANIDAVGIDNYMPLADWRDGENHADAVYANSAYDLDYLTSNIAGGEGYDWYYASDADRLSGVRTSISDGAGEPWIWRFKDIANWWGQPHHNRPGGVREAMSTDWVPGGKPVWFTELGCGAVDKGANQPNKFADPKSAESGLPYFSNGNADPLMQRQFLRAQQQFWRDPANNPAGMVDIDRLYLWTWDARPFPAFPGLLDVWADGANYVTGHWLTGRLGGVAADELIRAIAGDYGVLPDRVAVNGPFLQGYQLAGAGNCRDALEPVLSACGLGVRSSATGLVIEPAGQRANIAIDPDRLATTDKPTLARRRGDPGEAVNRLALSYVDRDHDYLSAEVSAVRNDAGVLVGQSSALVLDVGSARVVAERQLAGLGQEIETVNLALPPSRAAVEIGDMLAMGGDAPLQITEIRDGDVRTITARSLPNPGGIKVLAALPRQTNRAPMARAMPLVTIAQLPPAPDAPTKQRLAVAAFANPWPGTVSVVDAASGVQLVQLSRRGGVGVTIAPLAGGPTQVWDRGNVLTLRLYAGHPASLAPATVLAGGNRLALENDAGQWEVIGFAGAELIAPQTYALTQLLRGLQGSDAAIGTVSAGNRVLLLDSRTTILASDNSWLEGEHELRVYGGAADITGTQLTVTGQSEAVLPLSPVHLQARRDAGTGDIVCRWVRRSRADDNGWVAADAPLVLVPEAYQLSVSLGGVVKRTVECGAAEWTYALADQISDFGSAPDNFDFVVSQIDPVFGPGHAGLGEFDG
ncbi:glycoside hydrolase TIM-barrel-like domain-containing protein [Devosia rhodophyticola]|uniref:Glycoside hydrolase TIM-barrel-like domain-containing protein n=1 Tax=Devosia rhodophyticola TaxID=3026423 RepID=A0ABY7YYS9_9HYPH|nr:glycoside hydrolase TIM-barrel-like domain-containing protein [Devosia rhodophyticola]WDR06392.1 glycoside hydrolase TIM-barrel-like domain-containing protein [Devosia rhodophyticola]